VTVYSAVWGAYCTRLSHQYRPRMTSEIQLLTATKFRYVWRHLLKNWMRRRRNWPTSCTRNNGMLRNLMTLSFCG